MKRILAATALALVSAVGGVAALTATTATPAMADAMSTTTMQKSEARGLFVFPAYNKAAFDARIATGAPTILVFTKQGCPVCTRQIRALQDVLKEPAFAALTVQQVDFVNQADIARAYGVSGQSTILGFKAGREANRRSGDVTPDAIRAQLSTLIG